MQFIRERVTAWLCTQMANSCEWHLALVNTVVLTGYNNPTLNVEQLRNYYGEYTYPLELLD